ncbi:hypothetical protein JKP88DRAFT_354608 [Tribonema minus]|uniref:RRM domain-containing protein n=1 Tax=Tribonema minus TaxID=303371 RepID=A0A835YXB9_9STRA|nr:hypothetical protein JKP88DRAFT_354608 [Tribonema minus]
MAELYAVDPPGKIYWDRKTYASFEQHVAALKGSRTLYIGNLSFYTTEAQIAELFSKAQKAELFSKIAELFSKTGELLRVIMGLDRNRRTPCGFAFVEYRHSCDALAAIRDISCDALAAIRDVSCDALAAMRDVSGTCLDERIIRAELDPGFQDGRQYGRGTSGGQVRDERNKQYGGVDLARQAPPMDSQLGFAGLAPQLSEVATTALTTATSTAAAAAAAAAATQHTATNTLLPPHTPAAATKWTSSDAHCPPRDREMDEFGRALPSKRQREPSVETAAAAASPPAAAAAAAAAAPESAAAVAAAAPAEPAPMDAGAEEVKELSPPEAAAAEDLSTGAKKRARDDDADADNDEAAQLSKRSKLDENDMLAKETEAAAADTAAAAATAAAPTAAAATAAAATAAAAAADAAPDAAAAAAAPEAE